MTEIEWLRMFGNNLARMIYESRLTQKELSDLTGISEGTISKYVNGQQMPGVKAILGLSYVLGCTSDDLIDFGTTIN